MAKMLIVCLLSVVLISILTILRPKSNKLSLTAPPPTLRPTIILASGLPDSHQIRALFVPQAPFRDWQQPWQDACEEAALLTVDYYYRGITGRTPDWIRTDLENMFAYEKSRGWGHDINQDQMVSLSQNYLHYQPQKISNPSLEDLKKYLSRDIPIMATANGKALFAENKHFKSGGPYYHAVVILGYDDVRQKFTVHDVGTQFGAYFQYSYDLLMSAIRDFPASGHKEDIDSGSTSVIILLK